jgi:hypothetical protein
MVFATVRKPPPPRYMLNRASSHGLLQAPTRFISRICIHGSYIRQNFGRKLVLFWDIDDCGRQQPATTFIGCVLDGQRMWLLGTGDGNQKHRRQRCLRVAAEVDDIWFGNEEFVLYAIRPTGGRARGS